MIAIEVKLDGKTFVVAGAPRAMMLNLQLSFVIEGGAAWLDIFGMNDLGGERHSHTSWTMGEPLSPPARLELRLVETAAPTPPAQEQANDDPGHLAEQAAYQRSMRDNPPAPRPLAPTAPDAALALDVGGERTVAHLENGREFLSLSFSWDKWRPQQARVRLCSFSQQQALAREGSREWRRAQLGLGERCVVELGSLGALGNYS